MLRAEVNAAEARSEPTLTAALAWWRTTHILTQPESNPAYAAGTSLRGVCTTPGPRKTELNKSRLRGKCCGKTYGQPRAGAGEVLRLALRWRRGSSGWQLQGGPDLQVTLERQVTRLTPSGFH